MAGRCELCRNQLCQDWEHFLKRCSFWNNDRLCVECGDSSRDCIDCSTSDHLIDCPCCKNYGLCGKLFHQCDIMRTCWCGKIESEHETFQCPVCVQTYRPCGPISHSDSCPIDQLFQKHLKNVQGKLRKQERDALLKAFDEQSQDLNHNQESDHDVNSSKRLFLQL